MRDSALNSAGGMPAGVTPEFAYEHSRIQGRNAIRMALIIFVLLGAAHIVLGSNPLVPGLAVFAMLLAMWPIARYGVMSITAILILLVALRYVGFPMVAKLTMGQALDTRLDQPVAAYTAVVLGVLSYLAAVFLANNIKIGKPLLKPLTEPRMLRRLSYTAFVFGFAANLDASLRAYVESDTLTISSFFTLFLHLSLIAATAAALLRSDKRRIFDSWTLIIFATEIVFAFAQNARAPILEAFLCLAITVAAFRGHFSKKQIASVLAAFLLITALTPMFLYVRGTRADLTVYERIIGTFEAIVNREEALTAFFEYQDAERSSDRFLLRYYDIPSNVFERFSLVNHVDVLMGGVDSAVPLGMPVLQDGFERVLPRFLLPNKPLAYSDGDFIYCELGIFCNYGGRSTAPLIGAAYAAFGWIGVALLPFCLGLPILLLIKKITGIGLYGNVWTIFLLISVNNQFVEGGVGAYTVMLFRSIPQFAVVMLLLASFIGANRIAWRKNA